ncbi:metalloregulator ArsR/SmtB family transcription factor [Actinomadura sp. NEAU-AAG7]|uniref:helix-turn-helix transcriptional regulator n=1 Tax=Actinomadura sp. NEAU-AAG7 TaxID=2839640 RepID=UPI001BE44BA8|nr:metalloregulator ArsR/SmtB family transcription factor [Actinomadura sp. NEAU-AAG7]MBT2211738.1 transcriptional regulator [Actinomadura sp. NEAU-AAG7]
MSQDRTNAEAAVARPSGVPSVPGHGGGGGLAGGRQAGGDTERDTRARVARLILEHGPVTASTLGERVGLTPAAIRRHLDALLAEGMIEVRKARTQARRGRGRPAKWFAITDAGRSAFVHAYDDLASSALRFLAERAGDHAVAEFARRQIADLERRYRPVVQAAPPQQRVRTLAEALSGDGYAAAAAKAPQGAGEQLCQHHCPVAHVAAEFPQLCEAETEAFSRLLGTPVQRLATIAHGDGICTTHVSSRSLCGPGAGGPAPEGDAGERSPEPPASATTPAPEKTSHTDEESGRTSL